MTTDYFCGWLPYDACRLRDLDALYVACTCGKPWTAHGPTGQCGTKKKRYTPKRSKSNEQRND